MKYSQVRMVKLSEVFKVSSLGGCMCVVMAVHFDCTTFNRQVYFSLIIVFTDIYYLFYLMGGANNEEGPYFYGSDEVIFRTQDEQENVFKVYILFFYFSVTTQHAVGYGEIGGKTLLIQLITNVQQICGAAFILFGIVQALPGFVVIDDDAQTVAPPPDPIPSYTAEPAYEEGGFSIAVEEGENGLVEMGPPPPEEAKHSYFKSSFVKSRPLPSMRDIDPTRSSEHSRDEFASEHTKLQHKDDVESALAKPYLVDKSRTSLGRGFQSRVVRVKSTMTSEFTWILASPKLRKIRLFLKNYILLGVTVMQVGEGGGRNDQYRNGRASYH